MYTERIVDLKRDERFKYVQVFKNHGEVAGSYIFHPHSHVLATPIVPQQIMMELANSRNHYLLKERCLLCDVISQETRQEKRVVTLTDHFMVLCPFASRVAFRGLDNPRVHNPAFESWTSDRVQEDFVGVFLDTMKTDREGRQRVFDRDPHVAQRGKGGLHRPEGEGERLFPLAHRDPPERRLFRQVQTGRPVLYDPYHSRRRGNSAEGGEHLGDCHEIYPLLDQVRIDVVVAVAMLVFGGLFMRHVYLVFRMDKGELAFSSFLLGVVLFLVGGGLLLKTLGHTAKRPATRDGGLQAP